MHWSDAKTFLAEKPTRRLFQEIGNAQSRNRRSARVQQKIQGGSDGNDPTARFTQGATIVPGTVHLVELQGTGINPTAHVSQPRI